MLSVSFSLNVLGHRLLGNLISLLLCFFISVKPENFSGQWLHSTIHWLPGTFICVRLVWTLSPECVFKVKSHTMHFIHLTVDFVVFLFDNKSFLARFYRFLVLRYSANTLLYLEAN